MPTLPFNEVYWALIVLAVLLGKHFLADFPFQNKYMLRKTHVNGWIAPSIAHALMHGFFTAAALFYFIGMRAFIVGLVDAAVHLLIDLIPARVFRHHVFQKPFWVVLGADQLAHQLWYVAIVAFIVHNQYWVVWG